MKLRYLVSSGPEDRVVAYVQKGLAFAHARRRLAKTTDRAVRIEEQFGGRERDGAAYDPESDLWWRVTVAWTLLPNGDMTRDYVT